MKFRDFIAAMGIGLASLLAGCGNPQSMFHTAGPAAQRLAHLSAFIFILFGVVAVITIGILLAAGLSHRGTLDWHAPWNASGGHKFVLYGGLVIPGIILFVVFVLSLQRMTLFPLHRKQPMSPNILVIGHQGGGKCAICVDRPTSGSPPPMRSIFPLGGRWKLRCKAPMSFIRSGCRRCTARSR